MTDEPQRALDLNGPRHDDATSGRRKPKDGPPSVWVTSMAGLLSGDKECRWAAWFRSRYWYTKLEEGTFDKAAWTSDHTAMVDQRRLRLEREGWKVSVESANKFSIVGQVGNLEGKTDIVARKYTGDTLMAVRVEDCKTGKERASDWWQVLTYLYDQDRKLKELAKTRAEGLPPVLLEGAVVYKGGPEAEPWRGLRMLAVFSADITPQRIQDLGAMMRVICGDQAPAPSPSKRECQYCDIGPDYCSARWKHSVAVAPDGANTTTDF